MADVPAENLRAAEDVVARCQRLRSKEMRTLARAQNDLLGYLGLRRTGRAALEAVRQAADRAGRTSMVQELEGDAFFNMVTAAISGAAERGRDMSNLRLAAESFKAVNRGRSDWSEGAAAFVGELRLSLGRRAPRSLGLASVGAGNAIRAFLTWDLASEEGVYTRLQRQALASSWLKVAPMPEGLG